MAKAVRSIHPKIREERAKLAAAGLQNTSIAMFVAVIIAPALNPDLQRPIWAIYLAVVFAALLEVAAMACMRYVVRKEVRDV